MDARDLIDITDDLEKTVFRVTDALCARILPSALLRMQIFREGDESSTLLAEYPVWQRTMEGEVVFYWDSVLRSLPAGFYRGEFQINCATCAELRFRKRDCGVKLQVVENVYTAPCAEPCDTSPGLDGVGAEGCPPGRETGSCGATPYPPNQVPAPQDVCRPYDGVGIAVQTGECIAPAGGLESGGLCAS